MPTEAPVCAMFPLSILLVEDMRDNQLLIQAYLKRTPYRLDIAENGEIACGKFKGGRYDLVLMDMQMPVMDGYAATRAIRQWGQEQGRPPTPILALTAYALKDDERKSLDAGCTAHLTKPIKKPTLLAAIVEYTYHSTEEANR
jgi:two-component system sensor histidine kinase/response regulator